MTDLDDLSAFLAPNGGIRLRVVRGLWLQADRLEDRPLLQQVIGDYRFPLTSYDDVLVRAGAHGLALEVSGSIAPEKGDPCTHLRLMAS